VYLCSVSLHLNTKEMDDQVFRSKNLLTDTKNLSENYSNDEVQNWRQKLLQSQCSSSQVHHHSFQSKVTLLTDPQRTIAYCHVPKIATSSWMIVFGELNDLKSSNNFTNTPIENNSLHRAVLSQYSMNIYPDDSSFNDNLSNEIQSDNETTPLYKFVFLRHPFERLVSAFYDKFVQDPDPLFVKSVIHHEPADAEHLRWTFEKFETEKKLKIKIPEVISFRRFVKFVLYELEQNKVSHGTFHWIPYSDFCALCKIKFDFIGKLETLQTDLAILKNKFPEKIREKISDIFAMKKNAALRKSRDTSEKYFSQLSKKMIKKLFHVYKTDFLIGGYPYPEKYINLGT
jgi:chondroitin 4-sulfotransferase 11